jgi:hypothetical protein
MDFVMDLDPVAIDLRHFGISWRRPGQTLRGLILARSISRCEMCKRGGVSAPVQFDRQVGHMRLPQRTKRLQKNYILFDRF